MLFSLVVLALLGYSNAFLHPKSWNGLKITWSPNPFSKWQFDTMPRQVKDAGKAGFHLLDNQCTPGSKFQGYRYQYKNDQNVLLIFDKNGFIAGIQTRVLKSKYTPSNFNKNHAFVDDGNFWTLTSYVVNPVTICGIGRTSLSGGTGTGLYIQNGTNPTGDYVEIPRKESDIKKTKWGNGKCFWTMGKHYWFNIRDDMSCDEFYPYCVLYNGGRLDAFCFAMDTDVESTPRFEHPTSSSAKACCLNTPKCFFQGARKTAKQSTMHVYLTDSPETGTC